MYARTIVLKGKGGNNVSSFTTYRNYFEKVRMDYAGSSDITDTAMKALNSDYFNTRKYTSTANNMKAVAYMLDRNKWTEKYTSSSIGNDQIEYVIGGPSLEQIFKAYNKKYNTKYSAKATSKNGYKGLESESSNDSDYKYCTSLTKLNAADSAFVISSTDKAPSMWVASPAAQEDYWVYGLKSNGGFRTLVPYFSVSYTDYYDYGAGLRPVVCLKSGVSLELKNETYNIVQ